MIKFLKVLAIITTLLLVIYIAAWLGYGSYLASSQGESHSADGKAYVDQVIHTIASDWAPKTILLNTPAELHQTIKPELLKDSMLELSKLGKLTKYNGSKGMTASGLDFLFRRTFQGSYTATAAFDNGEAEIKMAIVKVNGKWKVSNFDFWIQQDRATTEAQGLEIFQAAKTIAHMMDNGQFEQLINNSCQFIKTYYTPASSWKPLFTKRKSLGKPSPRGTPFVKLFKVVGNKRPVVDHSPIVSQITTVEVDTPFGDKTIHEQFVMLKESGEWKFAGYHMKGI